MLGSNAGFMDQKQPMSLSVSSSRPDKSREGKVSILYGRNIEVKLASILYSVSVSLSVCLFFCAEFASQRSSPKVAKKAQSAAEK